MMAVQHGVDQIDGEAAGGKACNLLISVNRSILDFLHMTRASLIMTSGQTSYRVHMIKGVSDNWQNTSPAKAAGAETFGQDGGLEKLDTKLLLKTLQEKFSDQHIVVYALRSEWIEKKNEKSEKTLYILASDKKNSNRRIFYYHLPSRELNQQGNSDVVSAVLNAEDKRQNVPMEKSKNEEDFVGRGVTSFFRMMSRPEKGMGPSPQTKEAEITFIAESEKP
jgi:hypothetical protein